MTRDQVTFNIAASGIATASGSALVGGALIGPAGMFIGGLLGFAVGVGVELYTPRRDGRPSQKEQKSTDRSDN
jgi:hypothetical protein